MYTGAVGATGVMTGWGEVTTGEVYMAGGEGGGTVRIAVCILAFLAALSLFFLIKMEMIAIMITRAAATTTIMGTTLVPDELASCSYPPLGSELGVWVGAGAASDFFTQEPILLPNFFLHFSPVEQPNRLPPFGSQAWAQTASSQTYPLLQSLSK